MASLSCSLSVTLSVSRFGIFFFLHVPPTWSRTLPPALLVPPCHSISHFELGFPLAVSLCMCVSVSLRLPPPSLTPHCVLISLLVSAPGVNHSLAAVAPRRPTPCLHGPSSRNPPADIWPKPLFPQCSWSEIGIFQPNILRNERKFGGQTTNADTQKQAQKWSVLDTGP